MISLILSKLHKEMGITIFSGLQGEAAVVGGQHFPNEGEANLVLIIRNTLTSQGFNVRTAMDGEEGLRKFYAEKPDVLVADVMMPKMDGFTMVRQIRQTDQQTPVLFLTARSAIDDVVEGFELGANDYLKKPFGMMELIVRLRSLAGRRLVQTAPVP